MFAACLAGFVFILGLNILTSSSRPQTMVARLGREVFSAYVVTQYFAIFIFSMIRAARLSDERRMGSLPLLRVTPLSEGGVVLGSFGSVMARALLTMLLATPVLVISLAFGGFTPVQIALAFLITLTSAAHVAALTTTFAAISSGAGAAIAVSAVVQFLWFVLASWLSDEWNANWLHSFMMIQDTLRSRFSAGDIVLFAGTRTALTLGYLGLARWLLTQAPAHPTRLLKRLFTAADRFFLDLGKGRFVLWRSGLPQLVGNPVLWRERAVSLLGQRDHAIRTAYGIGAVGLLVGTIGLTLWGPDFVSDFGPAILMGIPAIVLVVILAVAPASTFARERTKGALAMLAATPLRARTFVLGKLLAIVRMMLIPAAALVSVLLLIMYVDGFYFYDMEELLVSIGMIVLAVPIVAMVLYAAAGARSTATGIMAGAAIVGASLLGMSWFFFDSDLFFDLLAGLRGLVLSDSPVHLVFVVTAAHLARHSRLMRNVVTLGLWLAIASAFSAFVAFPGRSFRGLPPYMALFLAAATAFGAGLFLLRGKKKQVFMLAVVLTGVLVCLSQRGPWLVGGPVTVELVCWGFLIWNVFRRAGAGTLNRTALTVLLVLTVSAAAYDVNDEAGFFHVVVFAGILCAFFLFVTCLQLDRLMERNG